MKEITMPNGGIHNCANCHFYTGTGCRIRNVSIDVAHWTTCINWNSSDTISKGTLYTIVGEVKKGGVSYGDIPYFDGMRVDIEQPPGGGDTIVVFYDRQDKRHEFPSVSDYLDFYNSSHSLDPPSWDQVSWLNRFRAKPSEANHYRSLRQEVWFSTVDIIKKNNYISANGVNVSLDADGIRMAAMDSVFYPDTRKLKNDRISVNETASFAIEADCLEACRLLQLAGYKPAVLNMANRHNPGGGVRTGSGAQEENIFRRSTAFCSLFRYIDYAADYGIKPDSDFCYPIPRESGGIYSPSLLVFRSSENTGYYLLDKPYLVDMITVPAIPNPETVTKDNKLLIADNLVEPTKEKMRAIFRIGMSHGHDVLVLSAFGCGAFGNPPDHVARLFQEVLAENEFVNAFSLIVFAIIVDHNAHRAHNSEGNLLPFQRVFN